MCERWYEYWFACIDKITSNRKREIRKGIVSVKELYNIEETAKDMLSDQEIDVLTASRKIKDWKKDYNRYIGDGNYFVIYDEEGYPKRLQELPFMPYVLFYRGDISILDSFFPIAMVGARRCSSYGEHMTMKFAEILASQGALIVSGMARGIDGIAHRGALNVGGKTAAVLGSGIDICYPREHRGLYEDIARQGCILSEFPPGTPPLPHHFPARNRIISGLAEVLMVMEAKKKSGSLITADLALEQGKDIYALPGNVENELSKGCNSLIYQGAGILLSPEEFLEELMENGKLNADLSKMTVEKNKIKLEREEKLVYSCLDFYPKNKEQILKETRMVPQQLSVTLVALELKGYIEERSKDYYVKRR